MNTIEDVRKAVYDGAKFYINFQTRSLSVNGKSIIRNGEYSFPIAIPCTKDYPLPIVLDEIEHRYEIYLHSVPSERSEAHRRSYFKALPENELSDEDMMYGESREYARFELEYCILWMLINGILTWHQEWGNWFWQSPNFPNLVILREWIEPSLHTPA